MIGDIATRTSSRSKSNPSSRGIPIYSNAGKVVGYVNNDIFTKRVKGSKHMMIYPPGWACDMRCINQLLRLGVDKIEIIDRETNIHYRTYMDNFLENSVPINRGHGKQKLLELQHWKRKQF